jgi:TPP-dependent pyruvate/acetoin dehydrogenase alpha subunit
MSRKMQGFEVTNIKAWKCLNCGANGTGVDGNDVSNQLKAHRAASPSCDETQKPKGEVEPPVSPATESETAQG